MLVNGKLIHIIADHREIPSGIPEKLIEKGVDVIVRSLKRGDYIIDNQVIVERKSRDDFVLSLIQGRLFKQCASMKHSGFHQLILIEGNPYNTAHAISREAIKGALLSISLAWQIPIVYSSGLSDTVDLLLMAAHQTMQGNSLLRRSEYKPKSFMNKQLYLLQGLPLVGPKMASALLKQFGSIEKVILAPENELMLVKGIGKEKAAKIRIFISGKP